MNVIVMLLHLYFASLLITLYLGNEILYIKKTSNDAQM